jgi:hypothetical protein
MMMTMPSLRTDRGGFALPVAILVIVFLTAGVMGAFARAGAEARTIDNQRAQQLAFAVAAGGLEKFFAMGDTSLKTLNMPGGTVQFRVWDVMPAVTLPSTKTFVVRATATTAAGPGRPAGSRTVAQFATRAGATMQVLSAWTSLSGLEKNGSAGKIDGFDSAPVPCGDGTPMPGVAVPKDGYSQNGTGTVVFGNPPVSELGTQSQMKAQIKIDWPSIANPGASSMSPDIVFCGSGYGFSSAWGSCGAWPTLTRFANPDFWPVIVINGSSKLPGDGKGKGTLIVTGDLDLNGGDEWSGIILVGGRITDNGSGHISGAVVTGLNVMLNPPHVVDKSSKANGTKEYLYNSCDVMNAASGGVRLVPVSNAWSDNWSTW